MGYLAFCPEARKPSKPIRVNNLVRLSDAKVADFVDVEDIAEKAAFCRCWKSKNVNKFGPFSYRPSTALVAYCFFLLEENGI